MFDAANQIFKGRRLHLLQPQKVFVVLGGSRQQLANVSDLRKRKDVRATRARATRGKEEENREEKKTNDAPAEVSEVDPRVQAFLLSEERRRFGPEPHGPAPPPELRPSDLGVEVARDPSVPEEEIPRDPPLQTNAPSGAQLNRPRGNVTGLGGKGRGGRKAP